MTEPEVGEIRGYCGEEAPPNDQEYFGTYGRPDIIW